jgi:hypothetical protein
VGYLLRKEQDYGGFFLGEYVKNREEQAATSFVGSASQIQLISETFRRSPTS